MSVEEFTTETESTEKTQHGVMLKPQAEASLSCPKRLAISRAGKPDSELWSAALSGSFGRRERPQDDTRRRLSLCLCFDSLLFGTHHEDTQHRPWVDLCRHVFVAKTSQETGPNPPAPPTLPGRRPVRVSRLGTVLLVRTLPPAHRSKDMVSACKFL